MPEAIKVEILTVGNEILNGDVVNTNSSYLCKLFTNLGGYVIRNVTVRDDVNWIASELRAMIERGTDLIITTGGLGPTYDDLTLQGVALATGRRLVLNEEALKMVKRRYDEHAKRGYFESSEMTPFRAKMATIPEGAVPLENFAGAAPGVLLSHGKTDIICLPGVPAEIKSIIENSLQDYLKKKFGKSLFKEKALIVQWKDESTLAPLLNEVAESYGDVYIKSRPKVFGEDLKIKVTFSARGDSSDELEARLNSAISGFTKKLKEKNIEFEIEGE